MNKIKVILDTNLWISYLISKRLIALDNFFENEKIVLVFSEALLEEFIEVAKRPKFKKYFSSKDLENLLIYFSAFGILVEVQSNILLCRDPKDNFLLSLSKDAEADYLITGDADLLTVGKFENTTILTYMDFILLKLF